jgi:hypothetical protein
MEYPVIGRPIRQTPLHRSPAPCHPRRCAHPAEIIVSPDRFLTDASARFERTCATALPQIWLFRPSPHAWSPGDVVEHVTLANRNMARRLGRLEPIRAGSTDVIDEEIPYLFYRGDETPQRRNAERDLDFLDRTRR